MLRFAAEDQVSPAVWAIEARRVVAGLATRILNEGLLQPDPNALGDDFSNAFDRWVIQLAATFETTDDDQPGVTFPKAG
ncbi:MAG: hypothetical protein H0U58_02860 [Chloroflexi bacterium]|nr:hypothetical protein [Chloroflexota bacterium]